MSNQLTTKNSDDGISMTFYYLDTGLSGNLGHHASYCRMISNEVKKRESCDLRVLGHNGVSDDLRSELGVEPFFRIGTYDNRYRTQDPIAGWLSNFISSCEITSEELGSLTDVTSKDTVFFCSVFPCQYYCALKWISSLSPANRPRVFV